MIEKRVHGKRNNFSLENCNPNAPNLKNHGKFEKIAIFLWKIFL